MGFKKNNEKMLILSESNGLNYEVHNICWAIVTKLNSAVTLNLSVDNANWSIWHFKAHIQRPINLMCSLFQKVEINSKCSNWTC